MTQMTLRNSSRFLFLCNVALLIASCTHATFVMIQVSEKQWYWLKAFALATIRDWDALEKFSKEKRPPLPSKHKGLLLLLFFLASKDYKIAYISPFLYY